MGKKTEAVAEQKPLAFTPAEYWEWRNSITELWLAQAKEREAFQKSAAMVRDLEIAKLHVQLAARDCKDAKNATSEALSRYNKLKGALEERLGTSLGNKVVDDLTFEIREAPADKDQQS